MGKISYLYYQIPILSKYVPYHLFILVVVKKVCDSPGIGTGLAYTPIDKVCDDAVELLKYKFDHLFISFTIAFFQLLLW